MIICIIIIIILGITQLQLSLLLCQCLACSRQHLELWSIFFRFCCLQLLRLFRSRDDY